MAVSGVPSEAVAMAFDEGDREVIQEMVMKDYWKMVRSLLRMAPVFQRKLDFLSSFLEKPVEEVLDAIATAHFSKITLACTQPNHNMLRTWINDLYKYANDQLDGAEPVEVEPRQDQEEEPVWYDDPDGRAYLVYPEDRLYRVALAQPQNRR